MQRLPTPERFDAARLQRLLSIVGPDQTNLFLGQLVSDLSDCETALTSCAPDDWTALRHTSHVLISLAGSVGAMALHDTSQNLNTAAHRKDPGSSAGLKPALLADLRVLITHVQGLAAQRQGAPE